jgi:hypothetical protein
LPKTGSVVTFPTNHLQNYPAVCQCKVEAVGNSSLSALATAWKSFWKNQMEMELTALLFFFVG